MAGMNGDDGWNPFEDERKAEVKTQLDLPMFGTLFDPEWLSGYRNDLRALLEGAPAHEDSDLWYLLCALDDISEGRVKNLKYDFID